MAVNRFVLNNISYHGAGAIQEIRRRDVSVAACKKALRLLRPRPA